MSKLVAPVLLVGQSGTGKSTAIKSLPPERTLIINTEDKPMPFEDYGKFKIVNATNYKTLKKVLIQCSKLTIKAEDGTEQPGPGSKYDYVVVDSFTAIAEFIERYCDHMYNGFDQWKQYNLILQEVVRLFKAMPQQSFMTSIPENKDTELGDYKQYVKVKGKELKFGWIESQFAFILYTNPSYAEEDVPEEDIEEGDMIDCTMFFKSNNKNTAKTPDGMFKKRPPNDMKFISDTINKFYSDK